MESTEKISGKFVIDWLSVTHRNPLDGSRITEDQSLAYANATAWMNKSRAVRTAAHSGYKNALRYENGETVQWHAGRPEMGTNYLYTGLPLKSHDAFELLKNHVRGGGRVRRLDIAIDTNAPLDIAKCHQLGKAGKWKSRCRSVPRYIEEEGASMYAGARTSDEMIRIYDKRAEQHLGADSPTWIRIELKLEDDKAINAAHAILNEGAEVIARLIRGYIDYPSYGMWNLIFSKVDGLTLSAGERKLNDTREWLLTQVASALTKVIETDPEFYQDFLSEIYHRDGLGYKQRWLDEG